MINNKMKLLQLNCLYLFFNITNTNVLVVIFLLKIVNLPHWTSEQQNLLVRTTGQALL